MEWFVDYVRTLGDLPLVPLLLVGWALAFAESGLGVGSIVPGETAVILLGTAAATPARFVLMMLAVGLGVTAGDHVGYFLGRRYGERMGRTRVVRKLGTRHWDRATDALRHHGAAAVFLTRLVPVVRTLAPAAAGASGLRYARFLPASLAGSLLWAGVYVGIGAFAGASASRLEDLAGRLGLILLGGLAVLVIAWTVLRRRRAPKGEPNVPPGRSQDEPELPSPSGAVSEEAPKPESPQGDGSSDLQPNPRFSSP
ncbi:DedA family protein [Actinomadura sp. 9N407]|uniref:DedA family protein n=1 Tax=Actinomadura sp. 9N407 TaxID=3375154 RepID=UPI00379D5AF5